MAHPFEYSVLAGGVFHKLFDDVSQSIVHLVELLGDLFHSFDLLLASHFVPDIIHVGLAPACGLRQ